MNDQVLPPLVDDTRFASLSALKAAHAEQLQRRRAGGETPELLDKVWSVVFTPDGQTLASSSIDGTIRLWAVP